MRVQSATVPGGVARWSPVRTEVRPRGMEDDGASANFHPLQLRCHRKSYKSFRDKYQRKVWVQLAFDLLTACCRVAFPTVQLRTTCYCVHCWSTGLHLLNGVLPRTQGSLPGEETPADGSKMPRTLFAHVMSPFSFPRDLQEVMSDQNQIAP
jgi:hypothetical protein